MNDKIKYLNVGCGKKYHTDWYNVDMVAHSKDVVAANLLKGIPFDDNFFEVVYHSQVLEHFPKEKALGFMKECFRILKPGGIIRVVVPDLENIVDEYKRLLKQNLENPTERSIADYEWVMLELFDQTVRNSTGGQMAEYLKRPNLINKDYIIERIGYEGRKVFDENLSKENTPLQNFKKAFSSFSTFKTAVSIGKNILLRKLGLQSEAKRVGVFRLGGEVHMWMYDRFSLGQLLKECGFTNISVKSPFESDVPDWAKYELDVKDGQVYDPTSLFMEAVKP